jgi:hypothetical protein
MVRAFVNTVGLSMEVYGSQFYFFEKIRDVDNFISSTSIAVGY